jgi:hypothetical protein
VAGHQRGTHRGGRHRCASASDCGGRRLECSNTHVDEAGTSGRLLRWWHDHLARWLAGDAAAAQGAEGAMERDGE